MNTTTQAESASFLAENDTGDLYRQLDGDVPSRQERVRRIKELVERGLYRPDMMIVASRILTSCKPQRT